MKNIVLILALLITFSAQANGLYQVSSKKMGIDSFDITISEIERKPLASTLNVPGFHDRSAPASRWMMCAYTDLAVKRGFRYWTVFYPASNSDNLLLVFPSSDSPNDPAYNGLGLKKQQLEPENLFTVKVDEFAKFCGIKSSASK